MNPNDNATNLNIKMDDTTPVKCDKCDNQTFTQVIALRRVSALVSPTAQEAMVPIQAFACTKCGHVNASLLPKGLNADELNGEKSDGK